MKNAALKLAWVFFGVALGQVLGSITVRLVPEPVLVSVKQLLLLTSIGGMLLMLLLLLFRLVGIVPFKPGGRRLRFVDPEQLFWDALGNWRFYLMGSTVGSFAAALYS